MTGPADKTQTDNDQVRQLWADGVTAREITARLHIPKDRLRKLVRALGLPPRALPQRRLSEAQKREVRKLWAAGKPGKEIADALGLPNANLIYSVARSMGLEVRCQKSSPVNIVRKVPATPEQVEVRVAPVTLPRLKWMGDPVSDMEARP